MIPKIDYSGVDPGYYEHKLNEVKSNKDLMKREYSKADTFAKEFISKSKPTLDELREMRIKKFQPTTNDDFIDLKPSTTPSPSPAHHPSRSISGLNISPIKKSDGSLIESEFIRDLDDIEGEFNNLTKKNQIIPNLEI